MELNTLVHEYAKLMTQAEQSLSRKEAVSLIRKASRLQDTINLIKESEDLLTPSRA